MARQARLIIPQLVHFVQQVGHNHQNICETAEDAKRLKTIIAETVALYEVSLHAFLISPKQLQLLLTPGHPKAISEFVQAIGRKYVPYFNARHQRKGALWNGRYSSSIVEVEKHGLEIILFMNEKAEEVALQTSIDSQLLSASSHYLGQLEIRWLQPLKEWWLLGNTPFDREKAYFEKLSQGLGRSQTEWLQARLGHDKVVGSDAFIQSLERSTGQKLRKGRPGRPARPTAQQLESQVLPK